MNADQPETRDASAPAPLADAFPTPTYAEWEALVRAKEKDPDRALSSELEDGVEVNWLYGPDDALAPDPGGLAGADPFVRGRRVGTPWAIRAQNGTQDRGRANAELLEDLEGGATELLLVLASDAGPGIPVTDADQLAEVLEGVYLDLAPVALAAGSMAPQAAGWLREVWRRSGHRAGELRGSLRLDPIGVQARRGSVGAEDIADGLAAACRTLSEVRPEFPGVQVLCADTTPYAEAGASALDELAIALATGVAYLRAGQDAGLDPAAVAAALEFTLVTGPDQFLEIAKLRAARRLWATVMEHCGVAPGERSSTVYVRTSRRMASVLDPWVNLLRATTAAFSAAVAGADGITVTAFDEPVLAPGDSSPLGRRMARNTQLVLLEEASLHRVADPAGGSWYVESLTDELAHGAWTAFAEIERAGGIVAALRSGEITRRVRAATEQRHAELARRRRLLTGVNTFPLLGDDGLERAGDPPVQDALAGVGGPGAESTEPEDLLTPVRDAAQFEALRARATRIATQQGAEPTILLACMGPLSAHVNAAQWAKSFFESGGIATLAGGVLPDAAAQAALLSEHGLTVAALCPGRDAQDTQRAELVAALREAGARTVYVVGTDQAGAQAVGADAGVRDGVDMVTVLGALLDRFEERP